MCLSDFPPPCIAAVPLRVLCASLAVICTRPKMGSPDFLSSAAAFHKFFNEKFISMYPFTQKPPDYNNNAIIIRKPAKYHVVVLDKPLLSN